MGLVSELARWAGTVGADQVPEPVRAAACRHLLDGLGTAVAAARLGEAEAPVRVAEGLGGPPEATVLGTGLRVSAMAAAFANGSLVHALDFDDTHAGGLVHPTAVVLPAAFAVGQQVGASGARVLTAALVGYEVATRLAAATPEGFHPRGAHPTSVCGVLAAAAVAGTLLELPAERLAHAMAIATSQAGGVMEFLHSGGSTKQVHPGWAAAGGIVAARLAAAGLTGPSAALEGEYGLYRVFADRGVDPARVVAGLGTGWETTRITLKPYPSCQLTHAPLDAARRLRETVTRPGDLAEVIAEVPVAAEYLVCRPRERKVRPDSGYAAKFSLPWTVAAMLTDGEVVPETFAPDRLRRTDLADLAERIRHRVVPYPGPDADAPGRLVATTRTGRRVVAEVARSSGAPDNPLDDRALRAKVLRNLGGGPGAQAVVAAMTGLAALDGLDGLVDAAVSCAAPGASE